MKRYLLASVALLAALLLAACGGGDDNATSTPAGGSSTSQATSTQGSQATTTLGGPTASPTPDPDRQVEVVKSGYTENSTVNSSGTYNSFTCALLIHNKSKTQGASQVDWQVTFFDASGANVGSTYGYMYSLFPDETRGAGSCGGQTNPSDATISRMEVSVHVSDYSWQAVATTQRPSATVTTLDKSDAVVMDGKGTATNPFTIAMTQSFVEVIIYNSAGEIIGCGAGQEFDSIAAGATVNWDSQVYINPNDNGVTNQSIDHIEAYLEPGIKLQDVSNELR